MSEEDIIVEYQRKIIQTPYGITFYATSNPNTIYLEYNPTCKTCGDLLKQYGPGRMVKNEHIIRRFHFCPRCKLESEYNTMDFSYAIKDLIPEAKKRGIEKMSIIKDPYLGEAA